MRRYRDQQLTSIDFMSIETIGEAHSLGWRVIARCAYSRGDGPSTRNHQSAQATMRTSVSSDSRIHCPRESRFYESGY